MNKVCVVGSFMMDLIARAPRRPFPGETLAGTSFEIVPGGKGYNQAVAASKFGADVSFVGMLGEDSFGDDFIDGLRSYAVDHRFVYRSVTCGTGVGLPVVEDSGENSIIIIPRANSAMTAENIASATEVIAEADVLLLQLELPLETALHAATIARENATTVVLNPAPYIPMPADLLDMVDILVPNEGEAKSLIGSECIDEVVVELARWWQKKAVVTLGAKGIALIDNGLQEDIPAHRVEAIDTIGAGDTFCGVLGASLASGSPLRAAAELANAAAAVTVTRSGGSSSAPTREEVNDFLQTTAIR